MYSSYVTKVTRFRPVSKYSFGIIAFMRFFEDLFGELQTKL